MVQRGTRYHDRRILEVPQSRFDACHCGQADERGGYSLHCACLPYASSSSRSDLGDSLGPNIASTPLQPPDLGGHTKWYSTLFAWWTGRIFTPLHAYLAWE